MKRVLMTLMVAVAFAATAVAMSFSSAREQALYLTDKMAYELYLTDDQYNACYEINLDYVLSHGQYVLYTQLEYFYRPISWRNRSFYFSIYDRYYTKRYFRSAPYVYSTYKGGNRYYSISPYKGRNFNGREKISYDRSDVSWRNSNYGKHAPNNGIVNHNVGNRPSNNGNVSFGNQKQKNGNSFGNAIQQPTIKKNEAIRQSKESKSDSWRFGAKR